MTARPMSTNACGVITLCLMVLTGVFIVITLSKFYAQEPDAIPKPPAEAPEITALKDRSQRNKEMILAGAEGAFLATERGMSRTEYIHDLTATLDALAAKFLEDEKKRLANAK